MKLTKYTHACIVLEEQGSKLVIDPGSFTPEFGSLEGIVAVVVTHVHPDHYNADHLKAIFAANPDAQLYTTSEVATKFDQPNVHTVSPGQTIQAGPFTLEFFGTMHQEIHSSLPRPHNSGVLVNGMFFYPGDSFVEPPQPVRVLAIPSNAPWASVGQSMDYLAVVKPDIAIPTHNGLLSAEGQMVYNASLEHAASLCGTDFKYLTPGESTEF
jgi:L-ascorbate metabolism protein UlaG (beta-lactamase superfamily)